MDCQRGIATRAQLWIEPIPLKAIKKYFLPKWNYMEVALTYMITGGVPYYLQQINPDLGFINGINKAFFSKETIYLEEVDELLGLEFNKAGISKIKKILTVISIYGASQAKIREVLKYSSSSLSELFEKLVTYKILSADETIRKPGIEVKYFIKDFYLNFYFSVYQDRIKAIKNNTRGEEPLFSKLLNKNGYYIENFSGHAFENLIRAVLESSKKNSSLMKKLSLNDLNFEVLRYFSKTSQVDIVIKHKEDRLVRIVDCKWGKEDKSEIENLCQKIYPLAPTEQRINVIFKALKPSKSYVDVCKKDRVVLVVLEELFKD